MFQGVHDALTRCYAGRGEARPHRVGVFEKDSPKARTARLGLARCRRIAADGCGRGWGSEPRSEPKLRIGGEEGFTTVFFLQRKPTYRTTNITTCSCGGLSIQIWGGKVGWVSRLVGWVSRNGGLSIQIWGGMVGWVSRPKRKGGLSIQKGWAEYPEAILRSSMRAKKVG